MSFPRPVSFYGRAAGGLLVGALLAVLSTSPPNAQARWAPHVLLSEVYGGGGNKDAPYSHDFIELYNPTGQPVSLEGWSVQYASAAGSFKKENVIPLQGSIDPFGTYLIQGAAGAAGDGAPLPEPEAEGSAGLSASSGQVALARTLEPVSGPDDPRVVDFVGYGTARAYRGDGPAPRGSNRRSLQRRSDGGTEPGSGSGSGWDTGQNALDWVAVPPSPRNSQTPPEGPALPVAVIEPLPAVLPGDPVELNGSGSWDPGGDPLTYRWRLAQRPPGSLAVPADPEAPRTTLVPDEPGSYRVELVVHDGLQASIPAFADLQVHPDEGPLVTHGPNPARGRVTFIYRGREAATLLVYDLSGKQVYQARLRPGPGEHPWDLLAAAGRPLAPGLYLYLVVTEGGQRSDLGRLVIEP